jgi:hypothetical protein
MRPLFKWIGISLFFVVALVASLLVAVSVSSRPPKESKITNDFRAHRAEYEQLRQMLLDDRRVSVVASWGVLNDDHSLIWEMPPAGEMPIERYQKYLGLLHQANALAIAQMRTPPEIRVLVWGSGFAADTRHVAVSWLGQEPLNTMTSLDEFYRTPKPRSPVYIHIDGKWYIWADW